MRRKVIFGLLGLFALSRLLVPAVEAFIFSLSLLSSVIFLESQTDFESLASGLSGKGVKATAPALILGKSGVKHEFAFAITNDQNKPVAVVDTELSVKDVDEMKVLRFYVKVFDVSPGKAILCVSPRLGERAKSLASEYNIVVLEDEVPRNLIPKAGEFVKNLVGT